MSREESLDIDQQVINFRRRAARALLPLVCSYCQVHFQHEAELLRHVDSSHPEAPWRATGISEEEKTRLKKTFSSSAVSSAKERKIKQEQQSGLKDVKEESPHTVRSPIEEVKMPPFTPTSPSATSRLNGRRKRAATGGGQPGSPPGRKSFYETRRSKGQPSFKRHPQHEEVIDPDFDRSTPFSPKATAPGTRHIWNSDDNINANNNNNNPTTPKRDAQRQGRNWSNTKPHGGKSTPQKSVKPPMESPKCEDTVPDPKRHNGVLAVPKNVRQSKQNKPEPTRTPEAKLEIANDQHRALSDSATALVLQPETKPISQEQLINEVKSIYAGLVMVEAKCVEVDNRQALAMQEGKAQKLSHDQWQALIALHRKLLHEHHDFFLASQHPSASPPLRKLAVKYCMPARMWRHGIHSFLEVLRHRLPDSLEHMLSFIYLAYSMMALLYETVPVYEDTWIECLGDLGRYRMAIGDDNVRDREVWTGVSRYWYLKAADKNPKIGRLYHHLALLARPNALQQLYYYSRSLCCVQPFTSARESILTLLTPTLENNELASPKVQTQPFDTTFIRCHALIFTKGSDEAFQGQLAKVSDLLDGHIDRISAEFKEQGPWIAIANHAAFFEYSSSTAILTRAFTAAAMDRDALSRGQSSSVKVAEHSDPGPTPESLKAISRASKLAFTVLSKILRRRADDSKARNYHNYLHVTLVFLLSLMSVPGSMELVDQQAIPWSELADFLNSSTKSEDLIKRAERVDFPLPNKGIGRPLTEDFLIRGQIWAQWYFPDGWFENAKVDEEERSFDPPSMAEPRFERILWLAIRMASFKHQLRYNYATKMFSTYVGGVAPTPQSQVTVQQGEEDVPITGTEEAQSAATLDENIDDFIMYGGSEEDMTEISPPEQQIPEDETRDGNNPIDNASVVKQKCYVKPCVEEEENVDVAMADSIETQGATAGLTTMS